MLDKKTILEFAKSPFAIPILEILRDKTKRINEMSADKAKRGEKISDEERIFFKGLKSGLRYLDFVIKETVDEADKKEKERQDAVKNEEQCQGETEYHIGVRPGGKPDRTIWSQPPNIQ